MRSTHDILELWMGRRGRNPLSRGSPESLGVFLIEERMFNIFFRFAGKVMEMEINLK